MTQRATAARVDARQGLQSGVQEHAGTTKTSSFTEARAASASARPSLVRRGCCERQIEQVRRESLTRLATRTACGRSHNRCTDSVRGRNALMSPLKVGVAAVYLSPDSQIFGIFQVAACLGARRCLRCNLAAALQLDTEIQASRRRYCEESCAANTRNCLCCIAGKYGPRHRATNRGGRLHLQVYGPSSYDRRKSQSNVHATRTRKSR